MFVRRSPGRAGRTLAGVLTSLTMLGAALGILGGTSVASAATSPTACHTANIYEHWKGYTITQSTYYCWYTNSANVYWVGRGDLRGDTSLAVKLGAGISWGGVTGQYVQCYPYLGRSRGVCVQTSNYQWAQDAYGTVKATYPGYTQVRIYFNGFAECRNSHDPNWVKCS